MNNEQVVNFALTIANLDKHTVRRYAALYLLEKEQENNMFDDVETESSRHSVTIEVQADSDGFITERFELDEEEFLNRALRSRDCTCKYRMVLSPLPSELGLHTMTFLKSDNGVPKKVEVKVWIVPAANQTKEDS